MSDEGYNGWKNYPTWAVNLWLNNDQGEQEMWLRTVDDANRHSDTPRVYVADALKENLRYYAPTEDASVFSDLLGYALDCVDWSEIADALIEARTEELATA